MSKGTLSPDGKFMWTGDEWILAPPVSGVAESPQNSPSDEWYKQTSEPPIAVSQNPAVMPEIAEKQGDDMLRFAAITTGWNGLILVILIFTAYSLLSMPENPPEDSWHFVAFKGLAISWIIGIILTIISRVKSARINNIEYKDQINFLNKSSVVILLLPLVPIALMLIIGYLAMKYGDNGKRYY